MPPSDPPLDPVSDPISDSAAGPTSSSPDAVDQVGSRGLLAVASRVARATVRGARGVARATRGAGIVTVRQARRASQAEGAGASGLSRLIELHAINAAGDAAIAISLAGTLFFQVPTGEARGQVALFLGLTMLPFVVVAPLIGPFLDRFSHGRRWAIGSTMAIRAFLCWALATATATESPWLFPAALGCLVTSKAYAVTRAAAVPRLLPAGQTLVRANARTSLAGVIGGALSAPLAVLASVAGPAWSLRYAFAVFVLATIVAIRLPERVDSSVGEGTLVLTGDDDGGTATSSGRIRMRIPGAVSFALRANCGPRWLSGFLTMFMAFALREAPIGDYEPELLLGLVIGAAGLGSTLGIALASILRRVQPSITVVVALVADMVMTTLAAAFFGLITIVLLGLTAGVAQSLAKLSLDSTIQRDVPERVHSSAFARSDTTLQLAWVAGGFAGIAMPLIPRLGLGIAAAVLGLWAGFVLTKWTRNRRMPGASGPVAPRLEGEEPR
ncbi:MAG: MFS transporter [Nocardioides sp.]